MVIASIFLKGKLIICMSPHSAELLVPGAILGFLIMWQTEKGNKVM